MTICSGWRITQSGRVIAQTKLVAMPPTKSDRQSAWKDLIRRVRRNFLRRVVNSVWETDAMFAIYYRSGSKDVNSQWCLSLKQ